MVSNYEFFKNSHLTLINNSKQKRSQTYSNKSNSPLQNCHLTLINNSPHVELYSYVLRSPLLHIRFPPLEKKAPVKVLREKNCVKDWPTKTVAPLSPLCVAPARH